MENSYLDSSIEALRNEKIVGQEQIDRTKLLYAEQIKKNIGKDIKKNIKPKKENKIKKFFDKLFKVYG